MQKQYKSLYRIIKDKKLNGNINMLKIFFHESTFSEIAISLYNQLKKSYNCELVNKIENNDDTSLYILFGAHALVTSPPKKYIVYQLEQTGIENQSCFSKEYIYILNNALYIFDYSIENKKYILSILKKELHHKYFIVTLGFYPSLINCPKSKKKTIDVLFYGSKCPRREKIQKKLEDSNLKVEFFWNSVWGEERNALIGKSKIVLNAHYFEDAILEIPRITHCIANKVAVVSEPGRNMKTNLVYSPYIHYADTPEKIVQKCKQLCEKDTLRKKANEKAFRWFSKKCFTIPEEVSVLFEKKIDRKPKKRKKKIYNPEDKFVKKAETKLCKTTGNYTLCLPTIEENKLPFISIITPTYNRRKLFSIAIRSWMSTIYPKNKMEWVIVDDGNEQIDDMLPNDVRIRYIKLPYQKFYRQMGKKRNFCVEQARSKYIVFMDDDDHYFPEHVLARIKTIISDNNIDCVGCTAIGSYDLKTKNSAYIGNGNSYFTESSLAFRKKFWLERKFNDIDSSGEYKKFLAFRGKRMVSIPFQFVTLAFTHGNNTTEFRNIDEEEKEEKLFDIVFNEEEKYFYEQIRKIICR